MAQSFISNKEQGFTLIELIVALALGLILVAAATQLFIEGFYRADCKRPMLKSRTSGIFGLEYMARYTASKLWKCCKSAINRYNALGGYCINRFNSNKCQ